MRYSSTSMVVVVVDPTVASVQMAVNMKEMVDQLKAGGLPDTANLKQLNLIELAEQLYRNANLKGVLFVLNRVRDDLTEQYLRDKLAEKGIKPLGTIHDTPPLLPYSTLIQESTAAAKRSGAAGSMRR